MTDAPNAIDERQVPEADHEPFARLVVVGSSAGGVDALLTFVATLPGDFPAPIVVAQHLDPRRQSHLGEILSSRSVLPVRTVSGDQPLEPGIVYVIAADRDVEISDHALTVTAPTAKSPSPRPSVDRLLATAARTFTDELVAVILTGTGSDGATAPRRSKPMVGPSSSRIRTRPPIPACRSRSQRPRSTSSPTWRRSALSWGISSAAPTAF